MAWRRGDGTGELYLVLGIKFLVKFQVLVLGVRSHSRSRGSSSTTSRRVVVVMVAVVAVVVVLKNLCARF